MPVSKTDAYESVQAICIMKTAGLAVTMPRLAVWMALEQSDTPLSAMGLHRRLIATGVSTSLSSVYAALKRLKETGLVAAHTFDDDKISYMLMSRRFRHRILCQSSGEERWVPGSDLHRVIANFCRAQGFALSDYTLSIHAQRMDDASSEPNGSR